MDALFSPQGKSVDYPPGDTAATRQRLRHAFQTKPARILKFVLIDNDFAPSIIRHETGHKLAGKGPVLASQVTDILHIYSGFFLEFPRYALLQRFAELKKPGDQTVAPLYPESPCRMIQKPPPSSQ
jgi:hypothetical protein